MKRHGLLWILTCLCSLLGPGAEGQTGCVPPPSGLISWWPGDGNALDLLGVNNAVGEGPLMFASGEVGQAFDLNGSSSYVVCPASPSLNVGTGNGLTIECWIDPTDVNSGHPLLEWNNGSSIGAHFWISGTVGGSVSGDLYCNLIDTQNNYHTLQTSSGLVRPNTFQHVALTYDRSSGSANLYLNGTAVATQGLGVFTPQTSYNLYFGYRPGAAYFGGLIDEVSLYNRALSASEIQSIYAAGSAGKCIGLSLPAPPINQTTTVGSSVVFTVSANGLGALNYQWSFDGTNLSDAGQFRGSQTSALTIAAVAVSNSGTYNVFVTNAYGFTNASATLMVNQAAPIVTWASPSAVIYGTPLGPNQLNATANIPGEFVYTPAEGSVLYTGTNTLNAVFSPIDSVDYSSVTNMVTLVVQPAPLTITASNAIWPVGLPEPVLSGSISGLTNDDDISVLYSCSATTNSPLGPYAIVPSLVDPDDLETNYTVTIVDGILTVGQVKPTVIWTNPAPVAYGTPLSTNQLNATANVPGTFAYAPTNGSILPAGTNLLSVTFTPTDTIDYSSVTDSVILLVESCDPPPSGIISWWPGDDNAEDIIGGNNGVLENGVTFAPGEVGQAFDFNGANQYVQIPDSPSLRPTSLTLECWFNASNNANGNLISKPAGSGYYDSYEIWFQGGSLNGLVGNTGGISIISYSFTPVPGVWTHAAYTFDDATQTHNLYVNGALVASGTVNTHAGYDSHPVLIGAESDFNSLTLPWTGEIDEATIFGRALSSNEIAAIYAAGSTGKCEGPQLVTATINQTTTVGDTATFAVSATGPGPLDYQWLLNGTNLTNNSQITGSQGSTLTVTGVTVADAGTYQVIVSNSYGSTNAFATLIVDQAAPAVTWGNPVPITYGVALSSTQLNASANISGSFVYSPTNGTVLYTGTNLLSVIFNPTDVADYTSVTNVVSLLVLPTPLTVTASNAIWPIGYPAPALTGSIVGLTNGDDISAAYSCSATTNSPTGPYPIVPSLVDPNDLETNYTVTLIDGTLTVGQATPAVTWTNPAPIVYGTLLSSNQLNATASVPGVFSYTPTNGTVLYTGTNTLSLIFSPSDAVDYTSVAASVTLVVLPATLTVTASNAIRAYGQSNPPFTGTIVGLQNDDDIAATFSCTAISTSPTGIYPIIPTLVDSNNLETNYVVTLVDGKLTVEPLPVILTQPQSQIVPAGTTVTFSVAATNVSSVLPPTSTGTLQLWLRADAGVVTNSAGLVSQWKDQSGNANDAQQTTANLQPQLVFPAGLGGAAAVRFNGIQDNVNGSYMHGTGLVNVPNAMTAFSVYNAFSAVNHENMMWDIGIPGQVTANRGNCVSQGDMYFTFWGDDYFLPYIIPTNTYRIRTDRLDTNLDTLNEFDLTADSETNLTISVSGGTTPGAGYYVGGVTPNLPNAGPGRNFDGDVAEWVVYQGYLSESDRLAVTSYLEQKYFQGGGNLNLTYQWQFNGTNLEDNGQITGSQSAVLTLADVTMTNVGTYEIIVSNQYGSTNAITTLEVTQAIPVVTWGTPSPIIYGTPLGSNQLNATASVPGSFAYSPSSRTIPYTGTNSIAVVFTPTDTVDYANVTNNVSLVVLPAPLTVTAASAYRLFGYPNPLFTGTIVGLQNDDDIAASYLCSATTNSPPGFYPIVPALVDPDNLQSNYTVTTVNGTLTVEPLPVISSQPQGQTLLVGSGVNLSVSATNPTPILPQVSSGTLELWLRADAGVVTNSNGQVSRWRDQSGNTNDALQTVANLQPELVSASGLGGAAAVRFNGNQNGSGSYLSGTGSVNVPNAMTAFTVYNAFSTANSENIIWVIGVPGQSGACRSDIIIENDLSFTFWNFDHLLPFIVPVNTYRIRADRLDTNADTLNVFDSTADSSTNFTLPMSGALTPAPGYYVGGAGTSLNFDGDIAEFVCYQGYLSETDRLAVTSYLEQKYYEFTALGPLSYQWQFGGNNLADATNSTFSLPSVSLSQAGNYQVVVSNAYGSITSAPALLDVRSIFASANNTLLTGTNYTFVGPTMVSLVTGFPNGSIYYTLNGSTPSFLTPFYGSPITVEQSGLLRAIAYSADFSQSDEMPPIAFTIIPVYGITYLPSPGGSISASPSNGPYVTGSQVTLQATPNPGWTFLDWLGDGSGGSTNLTLTMNGDKTVQAVFGTALSETVSGSGTVTVDPVSPYYPFGTTVRLTGIPSSGYAFGTWGNAAAGISTNPLYFTISNTNPVISALFAPLSGNKVSLTLETTGDGRVKASPLANSYSLNSAVTLTAVADAGQKFLVWGGNGTGSSTNLSLTMNQSKTVTATFTQEPSLSVASSANSLSASGFRMTITGGFGAVYDVEASTNLPNWYSLGLLTNTYGTSQFTDFSATNDATFYRLILSP